MEVSLEVPVTFLMLLRSQAMPFADASTLQIFPTEEGNEPKLCEHPVPSSGHLPSRQLLEQVGPPGTSLGLCLRRQSCTADLAPHTYNHPCSWEQGITRLVQRSQP